MLALVGLCVREKIRGLGVMGKTFGGPLPRALLPTGFKEAPVIWMGPKKGGFCFSPEFKRAGVLVTGRYVGQLASLMA